MNQKSFLKKVSGLYILIFFLFVSFTQAQDIWWISEYPAFLRYLVKAPQKTLRTSFKTGPKGRRKVSLSVSIQSGNILILTVRPPKESMVTFDERTGKKTPVSKNPKIIIRDTNLDGMLDDYKMEPGLPPPNAILSKNGFMKITRSQKDSPMFLQWVIGIAFCVNHFLHGVDSVFPIE